MSAFGCSRKRFASSRDDNFEPGKRTLVYSSIDRIAFRSYSFLCLFSIFAQILSRPSS